MAVNGESHEVFTPDEELQQLIETVFTGRPFRYMSATSVVPSAATEIRSNVGLTSLNERVEINESKGNFNGVDVHVIDMGIFGTLDLSQGLRQQVVFNLSLLTGILTRHIITTKDADTLPNLVNAVESFEYQVGNGLDITGYSEFEEFKTYLQETIWGVEA